MMTRKRRSRGRYKPSRYRPGSVFVDLGAAIEEKIRAAEAAHRPSSKDWSPRKTATRAALPWFLKPEGRLILGFGKLLGDYLQAKAAEILPKLGTKPMSQEEARSALDEIQERIAGEATTDDFDSWLDGDAWRTIDER